MMTTTTTMKITITTTIRLQDNNPRMITGLTLADGGIAMTLEIQMMIPGPPGAGLLPGTITMDGQTGALGGMTTMIMMMMTSGEAHQVAMAGSPGFKS